MTNLETHDIEPTFENARDIVWMVAQDLHAADVPQSRINLIANPCNDDMIKTQRAKIALHPERYSGVFNTDAGDRLIGFSMVNDWLPGDEHFFESPLKRFGGHIVHHVMTSHPLGIHSLIADHKEKSDIQKQVVQSLLAKAVTAADDTERELRTSAYVYSDDYLQALLIAKGFHRTHHKGYPVASARQELYVRPPHIVGVGSF